MRIIIHDMAHDSIDNIIEYLANYSITSPTEIIEEIYKRIYFLENYSYIGRYIPEMSDTHFREIIYKKSRHSGYRIMYYICETKDTIYIFNIINNKQDFKSILKSNNYFKKYFNL